MVYYRETYPDLDAAFGDDWDAYVNHWFEYGIKEGRDNGTNFDIIRYVNSYADLREAFDEDYEALAKHYIEYGMKENRVMALKPQVVSVASVTQAQVPIIYADSTYDENGRVKTQTVYSDESKTTVLYTADYTYNNDGTKSILYQNAEGEQTKQEYYYENGQMGLVLKYDVTTGKTIETTRYYENGLVEYHDEIDPETGVLISSVMYHSNGVLASQSGQDEDGHYFCKEWDENGVLVYNYGWNGNGYSEIFE